MSFVFADYISGSCRPDRSIKSARKSYTKYLLDAPVRTVMKLAGCVGHQLESAGAFKANVMQDKHIQINFLGDC